MRAPGSSSPSAEGPLDAFAYALLRVVPRVERGERVNVGVVLFCRARGFLDARIEPDERRLLALFPEIDLDAVRTYLDFIRLVCIGDPSGGPIASLSQTDRFGWLVAPASTVVQASRVHCGLCADPAAALERLLDTMVRIDERARPAQRQEPRDVASQASTKQ